MRLLRKLVFKFIIFAVTVVILGTGVKYAQPYIMKAAGVPEGMPGVETPRFSSDESDLMGTIFKSALRLFSGSATRNELSSELSDKLYADRGDPGTMAELGIEIVKPGARPSGSPGVPGLEPSQGGAKAPARRSARVAASPSQLPASPAQTALFTQLRERAKAHAVELSLIPVAFVGFVVVQRLRRRSQPGDFIPPGVALATPADSEPYDMKHAVHALKTEDFELLVALIYQRQGYRVSMPAGLSGGRGGDFSLARKSERLLVQCKKQKLEHKIPVERVRELHDAVTAAGSTRGLYVASCGFTWDARNFAKSNNITLINARTLDALIDAARETPREDLLAIADWAPKLMSKVQLTAPTCPTCEAPMEQISVSQGSAWVCSQRPQCRGRRNMRPLHAPAALAA